MIAARTAFTIGAVLNYSTISSAGVLIQPSPVAMSKEVMLKQTVVKGRSARLATDAQKEMALSRERSLQNQPGCGGARLSTGRQIPKH